MGAVPRWTCRPGRGLRRREEVVHRAQLLGCGLGRPGLLLHALRLHRRRELRGGRLGHPLRGGSGLPLRPRAGAQAGEVEPPLGACAGRSHCFVAIRGRPTCASRAQVAPVLGAAASSAVPRIVDRICRSAVFYFPLSPVMPHEGCTWMHRSDNYHSCGLGSHVSCTRAIVRVHSGCMVHVCFQDTTLMWMRGCALTKRLPRVRF
mmetsp:Transcript_31104/g.103625  ORF Transcript_31104/g.103625 Transcript_31104/m.103625 type:complete len:205 (+) Transcript_31104:720-1334(+)